MGATSFLYDCQVLWTEKLQLETLQARKLQKLETNSLQTPKSEIKPGIGLWTWPDYWIYKQTNNFEKIENN